MGLWNFESDTNIPWPTRLGFEIVTFFKCVRIFFYHSVMKTQLDEGGGRMLLGDKLCSYDIYFSSSCWASVANAPNVLRPYWLIVLPLDVPDLTASLL